MEIPRCPSGKATRQRLNDSKFNQMFLPKNQLKFSSADGSNGSSSSNGGGPSTGNAHQKPESDSVGSYEATPILSSDSETGLGPSPNCLYPSLVSCDEPIIAVMQHLANRPWMKAAEKSFADSGIFKISDLAKLTKTKAHTFDKFLKAPDSVTTIREGLRKFEKTSKKRENEKQGAAAVATVAPSNPVAVADESVAAVDAASTKKTGIASIVELSTPEEEDQTMQEIYDRPSPSPTEELSLEKEAASESLVMPNLTQSISVPTSSVEENGEPAAAVVVETNVDESTEQDGQTFDSCDVQSDDKIQNMSIEEPVEASQVSGGPVVTEEESEDLQSNSVPVVAVPQSDEQVLPTSREIDSVDVISEPNDVTVVAVSRGDDLEVVDDDEMKAPRPDQPEQAMDVETPRVNADAADKAGESSSDVTPEASTGGSESLPEQANVTTSSETDANNEEAIFDNLMQILRRNNSKSNGLKFAKSLLEFAMELE